MQIPFAVGQVWHYQARPQESDSEIVVCKIEPLGDKRVVHISVRGLQLRNPHTSSGVQDSLPHLPLDEETLHACVTELVQENAPLPDYEEGYDDWKRNQGGVWTVPLSELLTVLEEAVSPKPKKQWWCFGR